MVQGAKGPGSERARERFGQGPIGRFAPGSELARERKGCESERCGWVNKIYSLFQMTRCH